MKNIFMSERDSDPDYCPCPSSGSSRSSESQMSDEQPPVSSPQHEAEATTRKMPAPRKIDLSNAETDMNKYIDDAQNPNTRRAIQSTMKAYDETMAALKEQTGDDKYKSLEETPLEDLPGNMCRFFACLVKQDGTEFNASSVQQHHTRLHSWALKKWKIKIKDDARFAPVNDVVKKRCSDSVNAGKRPGINAARAVPEEMMQEAINQGKFGRENPRPLIRTVVYHLMTGFGARACQETHDILNEDLIYGPLDASGFPQWIEWSERGTKTRDGTGSHCIREDEGRVNLDNSNPDICPVRTLMAYQDRKRLEQKDPKYPFLLGVKQKAEHNPNAERFWFMSKRMGVNMIGQLFADAFKEIGVNTKALKITATSQRKNLVQYGSEADVPGGVMSKMLGHALPETKYNYLKNRDTTRKAASIATSRRVMGKNDSNFQDVVKELSNAGSEESNYENPQPSCSGLQKRKKPVLVIDSSDSEDDIPPPLQSKQKMAGGKGKRSQPQPQILSNSGQPQQLMMSPGYGPGQHMSQEFSMQPPNNLQPQVFSPPMNYQGPAIPPQPPQFGGYQLQHPQLGGYQPQHPQLGGYQPQHPQLGGYQPQHPQLGGYQPQHPQLGGYQPQHPQLGYQPQGYTPQFMAPTPIPSLQSPIFPHQQGYQMSGVRYQSPHVVASFNQSVSSPGFQQQVSGSRILTCPPGMINGVPENQGNRAPLMDLTNRAIDRQPKPATLRDIEDEII